MKMVNMTMGSVPRVFDRPSALLVAILSMAVSASQALAISASGGSASQVLFVRADAPTGGTGQSWTTAFSNLTDALDAAAASAGLVEQIWVAQGVYVPSVGSDPNDPRTWTFQLPGGVAVFGGFEGNETLLEQRDWIAHPTILSGDILGDDEPGFVNFTDNVYHVVSADHLETVRAGIDGFIIESGNAAGNSSNFNYGGGGLRFSQSLVDVRNCDIARNSARVRGAGVLVSGGEVVIQQTIVRDNRSLGRAGGVSTEHTVTLRSCEIRGNISSSGVAGIEVARDSLVVSCLIADNSTQNGTAGGVGLSDRASMINCLVVENAAPRGQAGGVMANSNTQIVNSIIIGNFAGKSGGLALTGDPPFDGPLVANSIVAFNRSDDEIGGIKLDGSISPRIANSIVWGNDAVAVPSLHMQIGGSVIPRIDGSCVQYWDGSYGGIGNFGDNPMFVDPFGPDGIRGTQDDDLRIDRNSPCKNAGDDDAVPEDIGDLDGDGNTFEPTPLDFALVPRFRCDIGSGAPVADVDVGAHEYQPPPCVANFNDDCDLNIFDFLAFQTAFVAGDPRADLDHSTGVGILDIFDFLTFQSRFANGCP